MEINEDQIKEYLERQLDVVGLSSKSVVVLKIPDHFSSVEAAQFANLVNQTVNDYDKGTAKNSVMVLPEGMSIEEVSLDRLEELINQFKKEMGHDSD